MKELIEKIQQAYDAFSAEAALQVEKGNKAAGTRARKASLEVEKLMKEFRKESLTYQQSRRLISSLKALKGVRRCGVHLSSFQEYVWHSISESSLQFGSDIIIENPDI